MSTLVIMTWCLAEGGCARPIEQGAVGLAELRAAFNKRPNPHVLIGRDPSVKCRNNTRRQLLYITGGGGAYGSFPINAKRLEKKTKLNI